MLASTITKNASDSPYARQLHKGHSRLRFDEPLENLFLQHYIKHHIAKVRWTICMAIGLFILFALLDEYLLPNEVVAWGTPIRAVVVALLVFNLIATSSSRLKGALQPITMASCILAGAAVIFIVCIAQFYETGIPFTGMLLIVFVFYFLSGLLFLQALITGMICFGLYIALALSFESPMVDILYNTAFLLAANLIGCIGCYSYEHTARTNFLVNSLLNEVAERDGLTGLFNRRALDVHLDQLWRQARRKKTPIAIAMMDVDHFKRYNDHFGHQMGDQALQKIAEVLKAFSQRSTDLVARYGGEEFIGVWSDLSLQDSQDLAERIRREIEQTLAMPQSPDASQKVVTISIGLSYTIPQSSEDMEQLISQADQALYRAKEKGRNRIETAV